MSLDSTRRPPQTREVPGGGAATCQDGLPGSLCLLRTPSEVSSSEYEKTRAANHGNQTP